VGCSRRAQGGVVEHAPASVVGVGAIPVAGALDVLDCDVRGLGASVRGAGGDEGLDLGPPRIDGLLQPISLGQLGAQDAQVEHPPAFAGLLHRGRYQGQPHAKAVDIINRLICDIRHYRQRISDLSYDEVELELGGSW
jgi:hypothetical protein